MIPPGELIDAAWGDPDAQVLLAKRALAAGTLGHADRVVSTVESLTFARLAAAQGSIGGMGMVVALSAQLADLMDSAGHQDSAADLRGEALAVADVAMDRTDDESLGEILGAYLASAEAAGPDVAQAATPYRRSWQDL